MPMKQLNIVYYYKLHTKLKKRIQPSMSFINYPIFICCPLFIVEVWQ